jgi:hypothetical protein
MIDLIEEKKEKQKFYGDVTEVIDRAHHDMMQELMATGEIDDGRLAALSGGMDVANDVMLATIASLMADVVMAKEIYRDLPPDELRKKMPDIFDGVRDGGLKKIISGKTNLKIMIAALTMINPAAILQSAQKAFEELTELTIIEVERRRATK